MSNVDHFSIPSLCCRGSGFNLRLQSIVGSVKAAFTQVVIERPVCITCDTVTDGCVALFLARQLRHAAHGIASVIAWVHFSIPSLRRMVSMRCHRKGVMLSPSQTRRSAHTRSRLSFSASVMLCPCRGFRHGVNGRANRAICLTRAHPRNRTVLPSFQASANEPESNRHFSSHLLCFSHGRAPSRRRLHRTSRRGLSRTCVAGRHRP